MKTSSIRIGFSTNLIDGLNPDWQPQSGKLDILYPAAKQSMELKDIVWPTTRGQWSFPDITLHENAASLLNELIPYQVVAPSSDVDTPGIGAGALLCGAQGSEASLDQLSNAIGVDLTNAEHRYALVKLRRIDGTDTHSSAASGILVHARPRQPDPSYGLHDDFVSNSTKLPHAGRSRLQDYGSQLSEDKATTVLNSFSEYGTHYVSSVEVGDTILQVFAYSPEKFEPIKKAYADGTGNPLSGPGSQNFVQFTTNSHTGVFGYVEQYGAIICLSNADVFNTTLRNDDWLDSTWSRKNSVFALFNKHPKLSLIDLQDKFTEQAPVSVTLACLSVMLEQKRGLLWQRIFKGAMVQKYRDSIQANFAIYDKRDFVSMLPQDTAGLVSYIATPTINVYKTRLDLTSIQFVAAEEVKDFTVLANVLSVTSSVPVAIPGGNINLFAQVLDMRVQGQPRCLQLADDAFDSLQLACDEFLGALVVRNQSGTRYDVIVDGLRFGLNGSGPTAKPVIASDVRVLPPASTVPKLIDSLQFSMTFAEAVLSNQSGCPNDKIQGFVRKYLIWLSKFVPAESSDPEVLALRVRAMDLAHYVTDSAYGSFVPILPYTDYQPYAQSILDYLDRIQLQLAANQQKIDNRRTNELIIDVGKTLNQNIIETGQLIGDIIDANAEQQKDLEGYYDALIKQGHAEADSQQSKLNELKAQLLEAQGEVGQAVQQYKSAVEQWKTMEAIKFGLQVAIDLFSLGAAIIAPGSSLTLVKELARLAQLIQKTLNVLNAGLKLYSDSAAGVKGLKDAQGTLDALDDAQFGNPSLLSWDDLNTEFSTVIDSGPDAPDVKQATLVLKAAFSTMVQRGKAVITAQSSLYQIQREIYTNQLQKDLNTKQATRLKALQDKLKPAQISDLDRSSIDLVGLTGELAFVQNQMLAILAKAFLAQDQALQYAYLQPATPITSFSLLKFSAAVVAQNANTIQAKSALAPYLPTLTKPIDYVISGIRPEQLTNGNCYRCAIPMDVPEFSQYVTARIVSVVASVEGVKSTESGKYHLQLAYNGSPFHDRNIQRDPLNFRTPSRARRYEYEIKENSPTFADHGESWSQHTNQVTPFSTWEISFPNTKTNRGLSFDRSSLTIKLSFVLEARIVDPAKAMLHRIAALGVPVPSTLRAPEHGVAPVAEQVLRLAAEPGSKETLLQHMYTQGSCTNGWDVVFNMGLNEINDALKDQYTNLKQRPEFSNTIEIETSSEEYPNVTVIDRFTIEYGYPLLSFNTNNSTDAKLEMAILKGEVQKCSKIGDNPEKCNSPESISGETLTAFVPMSKTAGTITVEGQQHNVLKVQLEMASGAFSLDKLELSDATKVAFNKQVKEYFASHEIVFLINQLDLTNIPTLEALKPKNFVFKPLQTPSGNQMLQLFIMTGNRELPSYSQAFLNNVPEPLPQGYSSSMIIKSERVFRDVLPQSLATSGWTLQGVDPGNPAKAWSAKFTAASVTATVDLSMLNRTVPSQYALREYSYWMPDGNNVQWSLADMKLTVQSSGQLLYGGRRSQSMQYIERVTLTVVPCLFGNCTQTFDNTLSTDVSIDAIAAMPLAVSGSGREQSIDIAMEGEGVAVSGKLSGGGPSGSDDLEAQVNQRIKDQIPPQIKRKLSIKFDAISVFALKNLLFPNDNYITFDACAIPGDLLLLGNFDKKKT
ncbi:hypothetical protein C4K04_5698 [Pseudomonas chlororaphis]|uniref:MACPF domain-containing protein n=1 Tax=Pseudomonas chlororaphis TaxID=587753 RepID=A0A3G7TYN9_9PSED|nr:hypothetical protein [Pseudomonas chlororaphis]AZE51336.1 hypothetical protein C4K04_5698 [Pseudomonas chlororaphis]